MVRKLKKIKITKIKNSKNYTGSNHVEWIFRHSEHKNTIVSNFKLLALFLAL